MWTLPPRGSHALADSLLALMPYMGWADGVAMSYPRAGPGLGPLFSPGLSTAWFAGGSWGQQEEAQARAGAAQDSDVGLAWVSLSFMIPSPSSLEVLFSAAGIY